MTKFKPHKIFFASGPVETNGLIIAAPGEGQRITDAYLRGSVDGAKIVNVTHEFLGYPLRDRPLHEGIIRANVRVMLTPEEDGRLIELIHDIEDRVANVFQLDRNYP